MSAPPSPRRLAVAITAAVTATVVAVGVTAASLLGWLRPAAVEPAIPEIPAEVTTPAPQPSPVIFVPIAPTTPASIQAAAAPAAEDVQLVAYEPDEGDDDDERGGHDDDHHAHDDDHDEDDDD